MRRTILAATIAVILPGLLRAEEAAFPQRVKAVQAAAAQAAVARPMNPAQTGPIVRDDVDPTDDLERLLLLTSEGPLIVEFKLSLDGHPFRTLSEGQIDEMLKAVSGDGRPTWRNSLISPRFLNGRYIYAKQNANQWDQIVTIFDLDRDGLVGRRELRRVLAQTHGGDAFSVFSFVGSNTVDVRDLLDENKDGTIAADEIAAAAERLKARDSNNNDLLEPADFVAQVGQVNRMPPRPSQVQAALLLGPAADLVIVFNALKGRYGNAEGKILPDRFRLARGLFERMDLNQNGEIDAGEVIILQIAPPQLEFTGSFGGEPGTPPLALVRLSDELGDAAQVVKSDGKALEMLLPGLKLVCSGQEYLARNDDNAFQAESILGQFDKDKNGYLDSSDLAGETTYVSGNFERLDFDGDKKITFEEIKADYARMRAPELARIRANLAEEGPSLFTLLDTTGDGRISLREMQLAAERLRTFDKSEDGAITLDEMPGSVALTLSRGFYHSSVRTLAGVGGGMVVNQQGAPAAPQGPTWFVRMDRNGDGDLTPKEFLGSVEQFGTFDTNTDGFIERAEAEAVKPAE